MVSEYEIAVVKGDAVKARDTAKSLEPNSRERLLGAIYVNELAQKLSVISSVQSKDDVQKMLEWVTAETSSFMRRADATEPSGPRSDAYDEAYKAYREARNTLMRMNKADWGAPKPWAKAAPTASDILKPSAPKAPKAPHGESLPAKQPAEGIERPRLLIEDSLLARELEEAGFAARGRNETTGRNCTAGRLIKPGIAAAAPRAPKPADVQVEAEAEEETPREDATEWGASKDARAEDPEIEEPAAEENAEDIVVDESAEETVAEENVEETASEECEAESAEGPNEPTPVEDEPEPDAPDTEDEQASEGYEQASEGYVESPQVTRQELQAFESELDRVLSEVTGRRPASAGYTAAGSRRLAKAASYKSMQAEFDAKLREELNGPQMEYVQIGETGAPPKGKRAKKASKVAGALAAGQAKVKKPSKKSAAAGNNAKTEKPEKKGWLRRIVGRR